MARKREDPIQKKQFLDTEEIDRAIKKLQRRIGDIEELDSGKVAYNSQQVHNIEDQVKSDLLDIFGTRDPRYLDNRFFSIWRGSMHIDASKYERQQQFVAGLPEAKTFLKGLIKQLEEEREDFVPPRAESEPEAQRAPQPSRDLPTVQIGNVEHFAMGDIVNQNISVQAFFSTLADRIEASATDNDEHKKTFIARLREFAQSPWTVSIGGRAIFEAAKAAIVG